MDPICKGNEHILLLDCSTCNTHRPVMQFHDSCTGRTTAAPLPTPAQASGLFPSAWPGPLHPPIRLISASCWRSLDVFGHDGWHLKHQKQAVASDKHLKTRNYSPKIVTERCRGRKADRSPGNPVVPAREPALALCISNEFCHGLAAGVPKAQEL